MKNLQKKLKLLTLVLLAGLLFTKAAISIEAFIQKAGTMNEVVKLRQNPDADSAQVMELTNGQNVTVNNEITGTDGKSWYQIFVNNTTIGYVPTSTVTISDKTVNNNTESTTGTTQTDSMQTGTTQTVIQTITVTERIGTVTGGSAVRVRAQATTSSQQVASMTPNATCLVIEDVKADDGYTWYKVEFDNEGTTVTGYVRSDLLTVKEETREKQVEVTVPTEPTPEEPEKEPEAEPYSITSKTNAEGTTVWYLTNNKTGETKEISSLLAPEQEQKEDIGSYKIVVVALLILVIVAVAAAVFLYMRWKEADVAIEELRELQARARNQATPVNHTVKQQRIKQAIEKEIVKENVTVSTNTEKTAEKTHKYSVKAVENQANPLPKPIEKQGNEVGKNTVKTTAKTSVNTSVKLDTTTMPTEQKTTVQKTEKKPAKPVIKEEVKEVIPKSVDIVNTTKKEIQNTQTQKDTGVKSSSWKSKNFLTDDDDLEFDFLDMDDKK